MDYLYGVLFLLASYLIGSVPNGLFVSKFFGRDIRYEGSGNIGATNSVRVLGKKAGYTVFLFDFLKGGLILNVVRLLEVLNVWHNPFTINGESLLVVYGVAAVIGHNYSCFLKFKGGKGVATTAAVALSLNPLASLISIVIWLICFYSTGFVSLGSMLAAVGFMPASAFFEFVYPFSKIVYQFKWSYLFFAFLVLLMIFRHRSNIKRLINGTESSFKKKKEKKVSE